MANATFHTTTIAMKAIDRLLKSNFNASGLENLSNRPTMYVINHFTRAETFIIPYIIWKYAGHYVHCLADVGLFKGPLVDYFKQMGVVSTAQKDRDKHIIGDLMSGRQNWVIYPEGVMAKTKKLITKGSIRITTPHSVRAPHRGAAVLALKSEIGKRQILAASEDGDTKRVTDLCREYKVEDIDDLAETGTVIVPVTISYYPLRPGQNFIKRIVETFFGELPPRLEEELEIEGNLFLRNTDINVHFGEPLEIQDHVRRYRLASRFIPGLRCLDRSNLLMRAQSRKITESFMDTIYSNTLINIDHLVCTALANSAKERVPLDHLRRVVCLAGFKLRNNPLYRLHPTLDLGLVRLIADAVYPAFDDILELGEKMEIIKRDGDDIVIDKIKLSLNHMFHTVRVKNPMTVIANEVERFHKVVDHVSELMNEEPKALRLRTGDAVLIADQNEFKAEYRKYFDAEMSHSMEVGRPYMLRSKGSRRGIVLGHGYSAAPAEVSLIAQHLHDQGYCVYVVRLWGHGTGPRNLDNVLWTDWVDSYLRGYAALREQCDHIVFGGFSTGGLIAMLASTLVDRPVDGIFSICAPSRLKDIRASMAPAVHLWNEILDKFRINSGQFDYVESTAENAHINYSHIYVAGLAQLDKLMKEGMRAMCNVEAPTLILHGSNDPTVDVRSADRIYRALGSKHKQHELIDADRHVVIRGDGCEAIFDRVTEFLDRCGTCPAPEEPQADPDETGPIPSPSQASAA
jgi:esterase/lipase